MLFLRRSYCLALAGLAASAPASAHDFWIEPSAHRVAVGQELEVRLRVGEGFRGDLVPRNPARIRRFAAVGPAGEEKLAGVAGAEPAGRLRVEAPGLLVIGYHSQPAPIRLEARKFEAYLAEEGLERIIARRAERGESTRPGREIYSRCAKALVAAGGSGGGHDLRLGFPLELIPEVDPYGGPAGEPVPIRILYKQQPLEGALVVALARAEPGKRIAARSDRDGRVVLALAAGQTWLVKAVHMVEAPAGVDADWESLWASLTFETAAR